ncbi:MAG TPA: cysteine desulfurase, partial [Clostridiales bacterium]|nr:cysteine desulfurase [Clostridiales bacterium]
FLVDAAQGAGCIDIDVEEMNIDMLAFSGHKGLLGPQGTGGLYIGERIGSLDECRIRPLLAGGTGSNSREMDQPISLPEGFESGTLNTPGLAGLSAGIDHLLSLGVYRIREHKQKMVRLLLDGLKRMKDRVDLLTPASARENSGIVAFNIKGMDSTEVADRLDQESGIAVRGGLHCAPMAHCVLGTLETGAVRVSFGTYNTGEDVLSLLDALRRIAGRP